MIAFVATVIRLCSDGLILPVMVALNVFSYRGPVERWALPGLNMRAGLRCSWDGSFLLGATWHDSWTPIIFTKEHTMPNRRGGAVRGTYQFVLDRGTQSQTEGLFQGLRSFHSNSLLGYMTSSIVYVTYAHIKITVRLTFSLDKHGRIESFHGA